MSRRLASCSCCQLTAQVVGEPARVSISVCYEPEGLEAYVAIPVGAFADPGFPTPSVSVYEDRMHAWVMPPADAEHLR